MNNEVYIRRLENREIVRTFDVSNIAGTSNFERFLNGLIAKTDQERFYVDWSQVETK